MTTTKQMTAKAVAKVAQLNDEALSAAWMETEGKPVTTELGIVRGWLLDELQNRLGDDLFDEWLDAFDADGNPISPIVFFARK